jgi:hypothetical protein
MKNQLNEAKRFQKLAGLLKEYIESDPETITQAFQQAGIKLNKPVTYIVAASRSNDDEPVTMLGSQLLEKLEAMRARGEASDPRYNETEGVTYDFEPGEVDPDLQPEEVRDLAPKLYIQFSDNLQYEIYQAEEMKEVHPDREWDETDDEEEDYDTGIPSDEELFGLSEDADYESESGDTNAMGDTDAMNVSEAGNVKGIKIEIPGNSYASDFGKAAAREVVESFGPREYRNFLEAFLNEFKKITGGV